MGLLDRFSFKAQAPKPDNDVAASLAPVPTLDMFYGIPTNYNFSATREQAMSVPTIAQSSRNYLLIYRRNPDYFKR
jgi:hypothetical protein